MNCKIIADLLPLYHDEVVSEESRELVEEHLETCAECKKMLEDIHENVKTKNVSELEQPMAISFKIVKKRLRRKTIINIAVSIICAVLVVSALTYGVFFYETPVSYSDAIQSIPQSINSSFDFIINVKGHKSVAFVQEGEALYICYYDTFWTRYIMRPSEHPQLVLYRYVIFLPNEPVEAPEFFEPPEPYGYETCDCEFCDCEPYDPDFYDPDFYYPLNLFTQIDEEVTKIFYLEFDFRAVARDESAFFKIDKNAENAVLLWEKQ